MQLNRFEPWSIVELLHRDLDRIATRRFGVSDEEQAVADWVPAIDILEEKDRFVLHADLPGVDPADIEVSMENGVLTVAGERAAQNVTEQEGYRRIERVSGRFLRRFTLPDTADAEHISAKSTNGILEVTIPKTRAVQARRIEVSTH